MSSPGFPLVPPFAVTASYQNQQYGIDNNIYTPGVPSVFEALVYPPATGTAAETAADDAAEAVGFSDYSAANSVQVITLNGGPTGGTWLLVWGDDATSPLAYDISAASLQAALNGLDSVPAGTGGTNDVQTVTVTGTPTGGTFTLTFGGQTTAAIAYDATPVAVQSALAALSSVGTGAAGSYATQEITLEGGATGGTFTLTFGGQTTSGIAYDASAATVQSALQALSSIGSGNATVEAADAGGPYNVTFAGTLDGPQDLITGDPTDLTGGAENTINVTNLQLGEGGVEPNVSVAGSTGGPYTITFEGSLGAAAQTTLTATSSLTGGTSPGVTVTHTTTGVAPTPNVVVTGSVGGPYTVTFQGLLSDIDVEQVAADGTELTGATLSEWEDPITVDMTTLGTAAFVNEALLNQTRQYDPMVNFYDQASGMHF